MIHKSPLALNLWLDPARRDQIISRLAQEGEVRDAEFQFRAKSGETRIGLLSGALLELDGRRCALLVVRDITDRKAAEELLRSSEERFRSLVENLHVGIVSFDPQARLQSANRAALEMFGLRLNEIQGRTAQEIGLQPLREDGTPIPDSARPLPTVIATGRPLFNGVFGWRRPSADQILWTIMDAVPEFDAAKNLTRVLVSLTNINEQRHAVEALRESEERFRTLVRDLHVGVVLHGPRATIEFANQAATEMFGASITDAMAGEWSTWVWWRSTSKETRFPIPDFLFPPCFALSCRSGRVRLAGVAQEYQRCFGYSEMRSHNSGLTAAFCGSSRRLRISRN